MRTKKAAVVIGVMTFAIMNVTAVINVNGLPAQAEYGLTSIFYYVLGAIFLLIPTALVAAELASTFPEKGGIFRWVGEAFGPAWGFATIFYEWAGIVVSFPTVLIFGAVALAYTVAPAAFDASLSSNKLYVISVLLVVYWAVTLFTFRVLQASSMLSSIGGFAGTIVPVVILIGMAVVYIALGKPIHMPLGGGFIPKFTDFQNVVLASSIFLYFAGMEMQAVHISHLRNPARNYPLSILIATVIILAVFILGTLAVAVIIPAKQISLTQSLLVAFRDFWRSFGLPWMGAVMAALLAFGVLGQVSVYVAGPSTGLLAVGKAGYLPRFFQRTNANGIQVPILIVQGIIVSVMGLALTILPSVQSAYQILAQMGTIILLAMYVVMYLAAIRLRYTQPKKHRPFAVPGGIIGLWTVGTIGIIGAVPAMILSFVPPQQIATGTPAVYVGILLVGCAIFLAIPFAIYACRRPDWKEPESDFAPFDWEIEGRRPGDVSANGNRAVTNKEKSAS